MSPAMEGKPMVTCMVKTVFEIAFILPFSPCIKCFQVRQASYRAHNKEKKPNVIGQNYDQLLLWKAGDYNNI